MSILSSRALFSCKRNTLTLSLWLAEHESCPYSWLDPFSSFFPSRCFSPIGLPLLVFYFLFLFFPSLTHHTTTHAHFLSPPTFEPSLSSEQIRWISSSYFSNLPTLLLERENSLHVFSKGINLRSGWWFFHFSFVSTFNFQIPLCLSQFSRKLIFLEILLF